MIKPLVFISYSHKDENEKKQLVSHLKVLENSGLIEIWVDDLIEAGDYWEQEIKQAIDRANVVILLITTNFLTSKFVLTKEIPEFLKRRQNEEGLTIFPVIAKSCAWNACEWLIKMNVRPKDGIPIWSGNTDQIDERLATITREIGNIQTSSEGVVKGELPLPKLSFRFFIEMALGIMLLGGACLLTSIVFLSKYYLEGTLITGVSEITAIAIGLLGSIIIGLIFVMVGLNRLSAGTLNYILSLIWHMKWRELFDFLKNTVSTGSDYLNEKTQSMELDGDWQGITQNTKLDKQEIKERSFSVVLSIFVPGLGLVYRGRKWLGFILLGLTTAGYLTALPGILLHLLSIVLSGILTRPNKAPLDH